MNNQIFGSQYSQIYDLFHDSKNYVKEYAQIVSIFEENSLKRDSLSIFDFGCGTGRHLELFSKSGWRVEGFDISEAMLNVARTRIPHATLTSIPNQISKDNKLTISLFDVVSYQLTEVKLLEQFSLMKDALEDGGILILDTWQLEGVRLDPPEHRTRSVFYNNIEFVRDVSPLQSSISDVYEFEIRVLEKDSQTIIESEIHKIRAWSQIEIKTLLERSGFKVIRFYDVRDPKGLPTLQDWRFGAIAKK